MSRASSRLHVPSRCFPNLVRVIVDVLDLLDGQTSFGLVFVEQPDRLCFVVKMQAADGLAVVVVDQNAKVGLCVAIEDAVPVDFGCCDGADDLESFEFLFCGDDAGLFLVCCFALGAVSSGLASVDEATTPTAGA